LESETNITEAMHLKLAEDAMNAVESRDIATATVSFVYPDGNKLEGRVTRAEDGDVFDGIITLQPNFFTPFQIQLLALYDRAYRFQSESLCIPDKFGFFSPGPCLNHDRLLELYKLVTLPLIIVVWAVVISPCLFLGPVDREEDRKWRKRFLEQLKLWLFVTGINFVWMATVWVRACLRRASEKRRLAQREETQTV
jgi:hypothetical protein